MQTQGSGSQGNSKILSQASRIFLAGHRGMVGSAIYRRLQAENYHNIVTRPHEELDLIDQAAVHRFFKNEKIDAVILAAAKVGGIHANNTYRAQFIFENIMIQANCIHEAFRSGHLRAKYCNNCGASLKDNRARKDFKGRIKLHADIAHPINVECRKRIQEQVTNAFKEELEKSKQPGYKPIEMDEPDDDIPEIVS